MKYIVLAILIISISFAQFSQETASDELNINPKEITEATFQIIKSGTLKVDGEISKINFTIPIPQSGIQKIDVDADQWFYISDSFGNNLLLLEWENAKKDVKYKVDLTVKNTAKAAPTKLLAKDDAYLNKNSQITFNDEMRKIVHPKKRTMEQAAELAIFVNDYIEYDLSLVGELKPSDWVLQNKRGVCVEYANLLTSLLRLSEISTRYVVGYAYSVVEKKLIGHTWVEILAADGTWIPIDATWNQAGYLDATHIVTAYQENANQSEVLNYVTSGAGINWDRNQDILKLLNYSTVALRENYVDSQDVKAGEKGYATVLIKSDTCRINEITLSSCIRQDGSSMFEIYDAKKSIFNCGDKNLYWFFNTTEDLEEGYTYTCNLNLFDQTGTHSEREIKISPTKDFYGRAIITGPDTVSINEEFQLEAVADSEFIFYNDKLGRFLDKTWNLKFDKEGEHTFYLHSNGNLAVKTVRVQSQKEFLLNVDIENKNNITEGDNFTVFVTVENLLSTQKTADLSIKYGDQKKSETITLAAKGKNTKKYIFVAEKSDTVSISVSGISIASFSDAINVKEKKKDMAIESSFIDEIMNFINNLINSLLGKP